MDIARRVLTRMKRGDRARRSCEENSAASWMRDMFFK
jgi:hypothetical protein